MRSPLLKLSFACSAVLVSILPMVSSGQAMQQTDVFVSGVGGYNTYRIPAIVQANNGSILAFAEGRKNSTSDTGDIDAVLKRSTDGGKTWSALQVVSADGTNTVGNPVPIVDAQTGRIVLLTTRNVGTDTITTINNGTGTGTRTAWSQYSDDNGATWSTPVNITASVKASNWRWYATGPGHGTQLTRGPNAGRLIVASDHLGPSGANGNQIIYSDDHGVTWHAGASKDNTSTIAANESTAVQLTNGSVYVNARSNAGGAAPYHRSQSISTDGGLTFSFASASTLVDPNCQGSVIRYSAVDAGQSQNRILFSNPNDGTRRKMTIRSSFDETATWDSGKLVNRNPSGYSDLVTTAAGQGGGLLYENALTKSYGTITYASFSTAWLNESTLAQYDFRGRTAGQTVAASSTEADQRGNGFAGTIQGAPTTVGGNAKLTSITKTGVHFDGVDDMIRVADRGDDLYDFEQGESFSLEVDFRTSSHLTGGANGSGPLISKDDGSNAPSFWMRVENGHVRFLLDDGTNTSSVISETAVSDGVWHDVVAERNAATDQLLIYVDGKLDATSVDISAGDLGNDQDLLIGAFNISDVNLKRFLGDIDYVRISDSAVAPSGFATPEPTGGLVAASAAFCLFARKRRPALFNRFQKERLTCC